MEDKVFINVYDEYGNPIEVENADNISIIVYIWGYKQTQPIAKIEDFSYSDMSASITQLVSNIMSKSNSENTKTDEDELRDSLSLLRQLLPNSLVTTYTYNLPYGISSVTDANGKTTFYEYDFFGRLNAVRDNEHYLIKDYSYHIQEEFNDEVLGTYTITADKTGNGTITPAGITDVVYGSDLYVHDYSGYRLFHSRCTC